MFRLVYEHDDVKFVAEVGKQRERFVRRTGRRGGYIRNADFVPHSQPTGSVVAAILDPPGEPVLQVCSYGPPFGGWANPSLVGRSEVKSIEYFDGSQAPGWNETRG